MALVTVSIVQRFCGVSQTASKVHSRSSDPNLVLSGALHHIREHRAIPFNRLEAVDQIGRAVVEQLIYEGRAAEAGDSSWLAWSRAMKRRLRISSAMPDEKTILKDGLGSRLKLDRWADMMLVSARLQPSGSSDIDKAFRLDHRAKSDTSGTMCILCQFLVPSCTAIHSFRM